MAKKKKGVPKVSDDLKDAFSNSAIQEASNALGSIGMAGLEELSDEAYNSMSERDRDTFLMMMQLAMDGVTPEEYAQFYKIYEIAGVVADKFNGGSDNDWYDRDLPGKRSLGLSVPEYEPLKDASQKALVLKIQMKDVTKPPMWREVQIPTDYNFDLLHEVIQEVVGLEDCHLWQFNRNAYRDELVIGIEGNDEFGGGLDYVTHDATETPLTLFLQKKGDKLEYVYDFGDDWIFTVEVKDVIDKKSEEPVCTKFKGELNAIEDFGGVWEYLSAREDLEKWSSLSAKERRKRAHDKGFDTADEYHDFLLDHMFALEDVNESLSII
ncbi:MAG: plasmid pRiA4b ORF-3 family protein [Muribaculaceae bacterium]|nr:plasmid pRiA4b ORF-3 family protein [Muribaculaceae bacterium]